MSSVLVHTTTTYIVYRTSLNSSLLLCSRIELGCQAFEGIIIDDSNDAIHLTGRLFLVLLDGRSNAVRSHCQSRTLAHPGFTCTGFHVQVARKTLYSYLLRQKVRVNRLCAC